MNRIDLFDDVTEPSGPEPELSIQLTTVDGIPLADTRVIAAGCGIQHENAYSLLVTHKNVIEKGLGIIRFETGEILGRGRPEKIALLTEDQTTALISMFRNTPVVVRFKVALARAFGEFKRQGRFDPASLSRKAILEMALDSEEKRLVAEAKVAEMQPKADFYDTVTSSPDDMSVGDAAKLLGWGRTRLFIALRGAGIFMRTNVPYQRFIDAGYFRVIEAPWKHPDGTTHIRLTPRFLQKGLDFVRRRFAPHSHELEVE